MLTVFEGRQQTGGGATVFTGGDARVRGAANSLRVGDNLHLALVVAKIPENATALTSGLNYSYNVGFAEFDQGAAQAAILDPATLTPAADLRSEKLLRDGTIAGKPHKALGYDLGELPGFALPPPELTDLRILHGSCRRPGFVYREDDGTKSFDGLAWVDDLILEWRRSTATQLGFDPNVRPHQLFFTGDQIYADDVEAPLLPMLNKVGNRLISSVSVETLPTRYPPADDDKSRETYVNAPKPPGNKTLQQHVNDLRAAGKDPLAELKKDRRVRVLQDPCFARGFQLVYPATGYKVDPGLSLDTDEQGLRYWEANLLHFPARLRRPVMECEAQFSTSDVESHLMSFGEFCAMYLAVWSNVVWELDENGKPDLATIDDVFKIPVVSLPQIWELHAAFPDRETPIPRSDTAGLEAYMKEKRESKGRIEGFQRSIATLTSFYDSLPRVRRALANVPTYMVFDDHDVTDDWNLGRAWRDRVFTSPLGRRILMNALVAYVVFQDWGNDPVRYHDAQGPYRDLLDQAFEYQPRTVLPFASATNPELLAEKKLAEHFGFNQPDPEKPAPKVKWHFTIDGPRHRVVALDTRTRRSFRSRYLPPGLLSAKALEEQLPSPSERPLPAGVDILIVISQTPPVLPSLAARVIIPLKTRIEEFKHHEQWRRLTGLEPDNEIWPGDDVAYEALLKRLAEYRKVVLLSGEVHYGGAGELSYWERGLKRLTLGASLEADLNTDRKPPIASQRLRAAFQDAGFGLSDITCVQVRKGNDEWIVADVRTKQMFLVRKEKDGLNVYQEDEPARMAQFVSSGLKNIKGDIFLLGRLIGFAFPMSDLTPAERLIWKDNTPAPVKAPEGGRFHPSVRDRLGSEPVLLPTGNWPPGTTLVSRPDFSWRADAVRDDRPDGERPEFTRPAPLPTFDPTDVGDSYAKIAASHASLVSKFRFARGVMFQSNFGLVRFELDDEERLVACQDLYTHPPGKHEGVPVNTYRVPLEVFGLERPKLLFDLTEA